MNILDILRKHDSSTDLWSRPFAWTKPKVDESDIETTWTFYGRKSAEEPEGVGKVVVRQLAGEAMFMVRCGACWWVDCRTPRQKWLDDTRGALKHAADHARRMEGCKILEEQRRQREVGVELLHGDVLVLNGKLYRLSTIEGTALLSGEDPGAMLTENARRRAENRGYRDPDRGNEWFPSWGPEAVLTLVKYGDNPQQVSPGDQYMVTGALWRFTEHGIEPV